jgi:hypothetical protein
MPLKYMDTSAKSLLLCTGIIIIAKELRNWCQKRLHVKATGCSRYIEKLIYQNRHLRIALTSFAKFYNDFLKRKLGPCND